MIALAEGDQQVPRTDDLALFDELLGDLLRGAADELLVAERGDRLVGAVEQRCPRRERAGAGREHVEQCPLRLVDGVSLLSGLVDERDHAPNGDLVRAAGMTRLVCADAVRVEHGTDFLGRQEPAASLPPTSSGALGGRSGAHRGPQRR